MPSLLDKLRSVTTVKQASVLADSTFFQEKDETSTDLPILNLAFSGSFEGGFRSGLISIAGPSKHFKSNLALFCLKAYLKKHPEAVCLYFDSEFGAPPAYLRSFGIDTSRVLHIPIAHVEMLKFEIVKQLDVIERGDKVVIFIDSVGNLASKKETDDAMDQKAVADMSRAKQLKSLWRLVTPQLTMKNIPCIAIQHTYETQEMYAKTIMSGGTGGMYSSDSVFIIGRSQDKDADGLAGYNFTINIEKSRYVREKSKFVFNVNFEKGINRYSGLLDLALEVGVVTKPKMGWYTRPTVEGDKNWRAKDTDTKEFWKPIFEDTNFSDAVTQMFALGQNAAMVDEEDDEVVVDDNND